MTLLNYRSVTAGVALLAAIALSFQGSLAIGLAEAEAVAAWQFIATMAFICITASVLHRTAIHPYVLMSLTACLFLGGRFLTWAVGFGQPVFFDNSFRTIDLSGHEAMELMSFVTPAFLALHAGYMAFWATRPRQAAVDGAAPLPTPFEKTLAYPAILLLLIAIPLAIQGVGSQFAACFAGDYLSVYAQSGEFATRSVSISQYALLLSIGLAFASRNKWVEIATVLALGIFSLASFGLGIRSGFLAFILLATWLVHKRIRRLNVVTVLIVPAIAVVLAQGAGAFSCRTSMIASEEIASNLGSRAQHFSQSLVPEKLLAFTYSQGTSLLSVQVASTVPDYPWQAYVQTVLPGFGAAASLIGSPIALSDLYFGQYMAKQWMPDRYERGEGFGWSLVSDLIVFSGHNHALIIAFAMVLGAAFALLISAASSSALWFGALVLLVPKFMLLPRAGLYSIFPYLTTFLLGVAGWWLLIQILQAGRARLSSAR
ncbi:hypothetical protein JP74_02945 [Devosia sp. 17-2-E-8]|nr:hypothetical protein JP74_02945 [Devosia sp. 17-2-E-8]